MKKVLTFLDDNFPFLILIAILMCFEYSMIHFLINIIIGIFSNTLERPSSPFTFSGKTSFKIVFCIAKSVEYSLQGHIIPFVILLIFRQMAINDTTFSMKAYKILVKVIVISLILVFSFVFSVIYGGLKLYNSKSHNLNFTLYLKTRGIK